MCGILGLFRVKGDIKTLRSDAMARSKRIRHRGPDASGILIRSSKDETTHNIICHERLAIIDPLATKQPFEGTSPSIVAAINGEIFNHMALRKKFDLESIAKVAKTHNDCIVIPHLYEKGLPMEELCNNLVGQFAFIIYD